MYQGRCCNASKGRETLRNTYGGGSGCISFLLQMHEGDPHINTAAWAHKTQLGSQNRLGRVYAESVGLAFASHLHRRYGNPMPLRADRAFSNRRLRHVLAYVHQNLAQDLPLVDLAEIANVSPSHFKVLFRKAVGMPVHQYIIRCRVELAVRLITGSQLSLSEIATLAGFANQSHMARLTRRLVGFSPAQLRFSSSSA